MARRARETAGDEPEAKRQRHVSPGLCFPSTERSSTDLTMPSLILPWVHLPFQRGAMDRACMSLHFNH